MRCMHQLPISIETPIVEGKMALILDLAGHQLLRIKCKRCQRCSRTDMYCDKKERKRALWCVLELYRWREARSSSRVWKCADADGLHLLLIFLYVRVKRSNLAIEMIC